jgi:hypothetical protein
MKPKTKEDLRQTKKRKTQKTSQYCSTYKHKIKSRRQKPIPLSPKKADFKSYTGIRHISRIINFRKEPQDVAQGHQTGALTHQL